MRDTFQGADWTDTLTLPAFLGMMALGRWFADGWVSRFGAVRVSKTLAVVSLIGGVCVVAAPTLSVALLGFALTGVGTAALFPLMISAAAQQPGRAAEDSVAAVILLLGVVVLVVPATMGWVAETFNLRAAFALSLPLFVVTYLLSPMAGAKD